MSVVDDVKGRLDIVETVSGYVSLQKSGRHFKAPCPFHNEKTPSFIVNPERQSWRCFGACATGGDLFSFVMRMEGLDFGEALRLMAQKAGVALSNERGGDRSEALYRINEVAARYFREVLESRQGSKGSKYLEERGVNAEARAKFELGLGLEGWDGLKSHLLGLGFSVDQAVEAGLLQRNEEGNSWDFFRGRLMFPIHDRRGCVVGFGARALDDSIPKYVNTAKTPIFDKGTILYGLHLASQSIKEGNTAILVEGYMDVIAAHQHGYTNVVASMGTALTDQQVSQLKSLATDFVMALDPDVAGQGATLRSLESSWRVFEGQAVADKGRSVGVLYQREPLTLRIAALPPGRDPDQLIRNDRQEWDRLTGDPTPLLDYLIPVVASRFDLASGPGKTQAVEALFPVIAAVGNLFEQDRYLRKLAEAIGVREETLKASLGGLRRAGAARGRRATRRPSPVASPSSLSTESEGALEEYILALLLSRPELMERASDFPPECFHKTENREVFTRFSGCSTIDHLRSSLDLSLQEHLTQLAQMELVSTDGQKSEAALEQCLQRLEKRHLQELQEGLLASEDAGVPPPREIEEVITSANARLKELFSQRAR